ncbi:sensor histidine kinase [Spirosoma pollinicola]|uniref:Histidine kinase n=1 Tax=Spirosoma pollinicola TaxID=2057025 RepID=A0A2K8YTT5_9BACT|nr:histidine kinase [Spirosoma pollinicola]AUD01040.1 histidine kinase [Spirosoma pollinicola]
MKIKFNKYVEFLLLWIALGGLVARQWMVPDITWQVQALLFVMSFVMLNLVWIFHYQFNEWLNQRLPFEKNIRWRIIVQVLGGWSIVKTVAIITGYFIANRFFPPALTLLNKFGFIIIGMMIFLVNTVICLGFIASHLLKRWQENSVRTAQLEKEKVQVQLDSLKNQVSPHFLFNSLSSLDSLIDDNPVLARQFLQQLSKVFRYVLQHKEKALVPLETELAFIKNYVSLLHTRFDGMFIVECTVDNCALEKQIVPVTLQILIENAIKHNVIIEARPLTITLSAKDDYLSVTNPVQRKRQVETSNRQGLENLKLLYSFLSDRPVVIDETDTTFQVRLPLLGLE